MDTPERNDVRRVRELLDRQADLLWEGLHPSPRSCLSARAFIVGIIIDGLYALNMYIFIEVPQDFISP